MSNVSDIFSFHSVDLSDICVIYLIFMQILGKFLIRVAVPVHWEILDPPLVLY